MATGRASEVSAGPSVIRRTFTAVRTMRIIWSAFLTAALAELVFFSVFDPFDLHFFGTPLEFSREAIYTMGFFGFWGLGIASAALAFVLEGNEEAVDDVA